MANKDVHIEITMTNNCNCNCQYCFESCHSGFTRNIEEENRQLKFLVDFCESYDSDKYDKVTISFWGGEPFLNAEFMFNIMNSTYKYDFIRYHIYSNGTLYDKYCDLLNQSFINDIKNRLHIQLSYDGEPHHLIKRGNTKDIVFKTAHLLKDNGIYFSFKATLSHDMIKYLPEIWDSYEEAFYEFDGKISYSPTLDTMTTSTNFHEWENALTSIIKKEYNFYKKHRCFLMTWFDNPKKCNCQLLNSVFINMDGNIYLCHGCPYVLNNSNFILGHTQDNRKLSDYLLTDTSLLKENEKCIKCEAVWCAMCHVKHLTKEKTLNKIYDNWVLCRSNDSNQCKYYQIFGKYYNILRFTMFKNRI